MRNNKIVILHVFVDGVIFSNVADNYDSIEGVDNLYYIYLPKKDFKLRFIKDERVKIIYNFNEYVSYFSNPEIDAIIFYSLPYKNYYLFDYIDSRKFVIWWAWGYDIYYNQGQYPPLVPMKEMYMPLTKDYMRSHAKISKKLKAYKLFLKAIHLPSYIIKHMKSCKQERLYPEPRKFQNEILARIDSFYAPLDIEYDLIKEAQPSFSAKRIPKIYSWKEISFSYKEKPGNILINHSLTYTDNHLDVFNCLQKIAIDNGRKLIIPVSYGIDGFDRNPENLIKESKLNEKQTIWLTKVLPFNEYDDIMGTASHAIYGALRQQALGNIYLCIKKGIKVFMYEDSIIYKELKKKGYILFSIERDLTTESLSTCLSERDAKINYDLYVNEIRTNSSTKFYAYLEKAIKEKTKG